MTPGDKRGVIWNETQRWWIFPALWPKISRSSLVTLHLKKLTSLFQRLFNDKGQNECKNRQDHCSSAGEVSRPCSPQFPITDKHRITEGQFYEAQQQTRVVAARYVKSENWQAATDILFNVSQSLLKAGQGGSGGDLGLFLIDVYKQAELKPDSSNKGKLLTLLRTFDSEEPTRKKFITEMIMYVY
jgi:hypothetical protein